MKKILIIFSLMLVSLCPIFADRIPLEAQPGLHNGRNGHPRMPSIMRVSADYENGFIFISIRGYTGNVQANVYDSQGNVVGSISSSITNNGTLTIPVIVQSNEDYTLDILLGNTEYYGLFNL